MAANLSLPLSLCRSSTDEAGEGGRNVDMGEKYARDARSRRNEGLGKQEEGMRRRHRSGFRDGTPGIANGIQDRLDENPRRSERQDLTHLMPKCKRTTNSDYHDHHVFKPSSSCPRALALNLPKVGSRLKISALTWQYPAGTRTRALPGFIALFPPVLQSSSPPTSTAAPPPPSHFSPTYALAAPNMHRSFPRCSFTKENPKITSERASE